MSNPSGLYPLEPVATLRAVGNELRRGEVLSFVFLFGLAVGLLSMNSFLAARIFFAFSAIALFLKCVSLTRKFLGPRQVDLGYFGSLLLPFVYLAFVQAWVSRREVVPNLVFVANVMSDARNYPPGFKVAGIEWSPNYSDIRLDLVNQTVAIENLDMKLTVDRGIAPTSIARVGRISGCSEFNATPWTKERLAIKGTIEGKEFVQPLEPEPSNIAFSPRWRVTCSRIGSSSTLHLVIAALSTAGGAIGRLDRPQRIEVHATYTVASRPDDPFTSNFSYDFPR